VSHVKSKLKGKAYDFVVIDHMHQMPVKGKMREGFIDITNKFLQMGKEENVLVIALAQFRKPTEKEADKRPTSNMIRESSTIAQDAHHVWILHDPEHIDKLRKENQDDSERMSSHYNTHGGQNASLPSGPKHAEIIVEKNREGDAGIIPAKFHRSCLLWTELPNYD
jgi:replicative DNA helicase